ncbi:alpha/beta hydrolase [Flavobacterium sp. DG1-102-2]|uniref:alpha/beta hydrolase n=1 Tax=Flavobacterium sp. DG1-102-2 TaxID=3081663 RepID=UPI00294A6B12|nr:alpha/beta hydrolase [Flavobacterium sp. DG1-102-2]MDV6169611.1 alpha/beta hydrolase [Flavobacterium sp. DG1-102-2]
MKKHIFLLLSLITAAFTNAQDFRTVTYFANDTLKLEMDIFVPKTKSKEQRLLLIHVHGGGFSGGERKWDYPVSRQAAAEGFVAANISYTLYMKGKNFSCDGILPEKVKAIQIAANQLQQAVIYFLKNQSTYNIDPKKVFISGSSAGAETVLHAAYWDTKMMSMYPEKLPADFRYAGVISGAGAIMDLNFITPKNLVPTMFFHGSCDTTVPYGTAAHHYCPASSSGWLMLFGSYSIYNHIIGLKGNTKLITFCGGGHEYSGELFGKDPKPVAEFMTGVLKGEKQQSHIIVATGKECTKYSEYDFCR